MRTIDRLDKYMNLTQINDNKITVNCGLSVGLLGKARKEGNDIGKKAIEKILNFYQDINRVWLLTGEGEMLLENREKSQKAVEGSEDLRKIIALLEDKVRLLERENKRLERENESQQRTIETQSEAVKALTCK